MVVRTYSDGYAVMRFAAGVVATLMHAVTMHCNRLVQLDERTHMGVFGTHNDFESLTHIVC